jgi:hypothetical protein
MSNFRYEVKDFFQAIFSMASKVLGLAKEGLSFAIFCAIFCFGGIRIPKILDTGALVESSRNATPFPLHNSTDIVFQFEHPEHLPE